MKKMTIQIIVLLSLTVICLLLMITNIISFKDLKALATKNLNIRYVTEVYHGDLIDSLNNSIKVSSNDYIYVKDVINCNLYLNVISLDSKIKSPVEGLVVKSTNDEMIILGVDNNEYVISNFKSNSAKVYEYVYTNQNIGRCLEKNNQFSYRIELASNDNNIINCINYMVSYDEV